jgi:hypothetical protein
MQSKRDVDAELAARAGSVTIALGMSFGRIFSTSSPFWSWMQETGQ